MILPQTYTGALLLVILSLLCLGSWANFFKLGGKWRFELYYFDFAIAFALTAVVFAFTLGSMGFDGFSVMDDLAHTGKRQWMYGLLSGLVFNFGNMLLLAAVSVAGMAVAFPVGLGIGIVGAMVVGRINGAAVNSLYLALGALLVVLAIVCDGVAYGSVMRVRREALLAENKKRASRGATAIKGMILSVASGVVLAFLYPLLARATPPEVGLGPYALMLLVAIALFGSTIVYNIFFMNLPVNGEPLEFTDYFKGGLKPHLLGFMGGIVCCVGMLANWMSGGVPATAQLSRPMSLALSQGGMLLAALWGLLAWREFRAASGAGKAAAFLMLLLLAAGLALLATSVAR
jgi:glucose uptake protein